MRCAAALFAAAGLTLAAGCDNMKHQNNYRPYQPAAFFPNGSEAQAPPAGTVAAGPLPPEALLTGRRGGKWLSELPVPLTPTLVERGRDQFDMACSPCHGLDGYGDGIVVQRGFPHPPSLHERAVRSLPDGQIYDVITNGFGIMYPASDRVPDPKDRWAVVAFVRALQLSQHATLADVPPAERAALQHR